MVCAFVQRLPEYDLLVVVRVVVAIDADEVVASVLWLGSEMSKIIKSQYFIINRL